MVVLEKPLSKAYPEIDIVTTPVGDDVAMVHVNNCTSDLNAWVNIFREYSAELGIEISTEKLYGTLYRKALEGDADCGGLLSYGYFSGENKMCIRDRCHIVYDKNLCTQKRSTCFKQILLLVFRLFL